MVTGRSVGSSPSVPKKNSSTSSPTRPRAKRSNNRFIAAIILAVLSLVAFHFLTAPELDDHDVHALKHQKTVVVVGGGLAGLSATLELVDLLADRPDVRILLLEKQPNLGGNSAKASSGMNSVGTPPQAAAGIADSPSLFAHDTVLSGQGLSDVALVDVLATHALDALWFVQNRTALPLGLLSQLGGHSVPRTHRVLTPLQQQIHQLQSELQQSELQQSELQQSELQQSRIEKENTLEDLQRQLQRQPSPNVGFQIMKALSDAVRAAAPRVELLTDSALSRLTLHPASQRLHGLYLRGSPSPLHADALVLATGGYASDRQGLLSQHAPLLASLATTNGPWATGDGLRAAAAVGARLVHMEQVQVHPTGFVDPAEPHAATKFLAPEALRGSGAVLVDPGSGRRFVDELGLRDHVAGRILGLGGERSALLVMNERALALYSAPALAFYRAKGFVREHANASVVAAEHGWPQEGGESAFCAALRAYGRDDPFGKTVFPVASYSCEEPLHVMRVTPVLHYTMGGLAISPQAEVRSEGQGVIPGLFAAGEVTGGLHGANRLAGNSLLECVVFGRIAARSAVQYLLETK